LKISAVIPVYNEEEVIDEFSGRLVDALGKLGDYEVIFVVEGDDGTLSRVDELAKANPRVRVDFHEKRLGLGKAFREGMFLVAEDADYVLTMDADLNHHPEEIIELLEATKNADVVVGSRRRSSRGMVGELPLIKRMISGGTNWMIRKAFRIPSSDVTSGFRVYSAAGIRSIRGELTSKNFEIAAELLIRARKKGLKITEVPITFTPRPRGTSKLSFLQSGIGYAKLLVKLGL
jgi:dolichol-phosphate mannosyltransferase